MDEKGSFMAHTIAQKNANHDLEINNLVEGITFSNQEIHALWGFRGFIFIGIKLDCKELLKEQSLRRL